MKGAQLSLGIADVGQAPAAAEPACEHLAPGAVLLRGFALADSCLLLSDLDAVFAAAPLRQMSTPGGLRMSVAMTSCGALGWVSDRAGYRYSATDPDSGRRWPALPASFLRLAQAAARRAGFADFVPDSCLINRYLPGCKLSLHQDKDERDFSAPIVSVSLGLPAVFLFGGPARSDRPARHPLRHGDVAVWGGPARLHYHGIAPIKPADFAPDPRLDGCRINLTLRRAG